jgi:ubiquinol-cytochrome c reductase cytochrome c1 subunit
MSRSLYSAIFAIGALTLFPRFFTHSDVNRLPAVSINRRDLAAQQRGASTFFQYCAGCHSLKHMRYTDLAYHFGWVDERGDPDQAMIFEYWNFINDRASSPILTALDKEQATQWFGKWPSDLSLITRSRSPEWVSAMLLGFYPDPSKDRGVGNTQFSSQIAMPHVLIEREEWALLPLTEVVKETKPVFLQDRSTIKYQQVVSDLIHFLDYVAEPHRLQREIWGKYVFLFLVALSCINYLFYKSVWADQGSDEDDQGKKAL